MARTFSFDHGNMHWYNFQIKFHPLRPGIYSLMKNHHILGCSVGFRDLTPKRCYLEMLSGYILWGGTVHPPHCSRCWNVWTICGGDIRYHLNVNLCSTNISVNVSPVCADVPSDLGKTFTWIKTSRAEVWKKRKSRWNPIPPPLVECSWPDYRIWSCWQLPWHLEFQPAYPYSMSKLRNCITRTTKNSIFYKSSKTRINLSQ